LPELLSLLLAVVLLALLLLFEPEVELFLEPLEPEPDLFAISLSLRRG
jgi:hypothetical protein